eukprot:PhM_4_TR452/c0_g1_i2/m.31174
MMILNHFIELSLTKHLLLAALVLFLNMMFIGNQWSQYQQTMGALLLNEQDNMVSSESVALFDAIHHTDDNNKDDDEEGEVQPDKEIIEEESNELDIVKCPLIRFTPPDPPYSHHLKQNNTNNKTKFEFTRTHFVIARFRESLSWLPTSIHSQTVYRATDHPTDSIKQQNISGVVMREEYEVSNFCNECNGYLRFIIDHYDHLPLVSVFLHAQPGKHNDRIVQWAECLDDAKEEFRYMTGTLRRECVKSEQKKMEQNATITTTTKTFPRLAFYKMWELFPWGEMFDNDHVDDVIVP